MWKRDCLKIAAKFAATKFTSRLPTFFWAMQIIYVLTRQDMNDVLRLSNRHEHRQAVKAEFIASTLISLGTAYWLLRLVPPPSLTPEPRCQRKSRSRAISNEVKRSATWEPGSSTTCLQPSAQNIRYSAYQLCCICSTIPFQCHFRVHVLRNLLTSPEFRDNHS